MTDQPETVPPWLLPPTPPVAPYYTSDDAAHQITGNRTGERPDLLPEHIPF